MFNNMTDGSAMFDNINNTNTNNNNNTIVFMDMPRQDTREGRVSVKDVRRSAACLLCRNRKRKCDGQDPCSYCVSKNTTCTYTQQKKRGPQKKSVASPSGTDNNNNMQIATPSVIECEMLDRVEAMNFGGFYMKYINAMVPMTTNDKMLNPSNSAHKVQSYAAIAYSARILGDLQKASKYISQARVTAGEIYDLADPDSIAGMLMMSNYWQLTLNFPMSAHYSRLANSLRRLMPQGTLEYRVNMVCEVNAIFCDEATSNKKKAKLLRDVAETALHADGPVKQYAPLINSFLNLSSYIVGFLNYNPIFVKEAHTTKDFFNLFDKETLDDETRMLVLLEVNKVAATIALLGTPPGFDVHLATINTVFTPMYMGIVEWRSNRPQEALNFVITVISGLSNLEKSDIYSFACGLLDFPHVAMLGGLCKFLLDIGHYSLAGQLCSKIMAICKLLTPELDFVLAYATEFMTWLPAADRPATITLLDEEFSNPASTTSTTNTTTTTTTTTTNTNSSNTPFNILTSSTNNNNNITLNNSNNNTLNNNNNNTLNNSNNTRNNTNNTRNNNNTSFTTTTSIPFDPNLPFNHPDASFPPSAPNYNFVTHPITQHSNELLFERNMFPNNTTNTNNYTNNPTNTNYDPNNTTNFIPNNTTNTNNIPNSNYNINNTNTNYNNVNHPNPSPPYNPSPPSSQSPSQNSPSPNYNSSSPNYNPSSPNYNSSSPNYNSPQDMPPNPGDNNSNNGIFTIKEFGSTQTNKYFVYDINNVPTQVNFPNNNINNIQPPNSFIEIPPFINPNNDENSITLINTELHNLDVNNETMVNNTDELWQFVS